MEPCLILLCLEMRIIVGLLDGKLPYAWCRLSQHESNDRFFCAISVDQNRLCQIHIMCFERYVVKK